MGICDGAGLGEGMQREGAESQDLESHAHLGSDSVVTI